MPRIVEMELRQSALDAFCLSDLPAKLAAVEALWQRLPSLTLDCEAPLPDPWQPGRPPRPALVEPQQVPRRSPFTANGYAALIHSIAHIEFNAINLALDAVWRFGGMPSAYYADWMRVAHEEAHHFSLLQSHLQALGFSYGDFAAHDGLWTMCERTRDSVVARMALVPRTLEARGLDATPQIQAKLRTVGSAMALEAVGLLDLILKEEVGHVAIGNRWYHWLCQRDGLEPQRYFEEMALLHGAPKPKPPLNREARRLAGFTEAELQAMTTNS